MQKLNQPAAIHPKPKTTVKNSQNGHALTHSPETARIDQHQVTDRTGQQPKTVRKHQYQATVQRTHQHQATGHSGIRRNSKINTYIMEAAEKYNVDPKLIQSVIKHESGGNANSTSPVGAQGLMQLMPDTAKALGVTNPYDPKQNIEGGTKYLRSLLDQFNNNTSLAVAAYNAGPGNVRKFGGIPPFKETQNYVKNVLSTYYHEI
ncbi:lytic transglycosylase domain-containing protein [Scopulibacillus daqui]